MGFVEVSIYILNVLMILIGLYLGFLYYKSKELHSYSFYNIIIMSMTILLDNIIRLIPTHSMATFFHYLQAFLLVFFDKMILSILSMQIIVIYIIIMWVETYINNEKKIFIIGMLVCLVISALITTIYIAGPKEISDFDSYFYCYGDWPPKRTIDIVFNAILLSTNIFCIAVVLAYFSKKKKAAEEGAIEDLGYKNQYIRFFILFFINILFITESYLIIFDKLLWSIDFIYLCSCLVVDLGYSINSTVINETRRIFCKLRIGTNNSPSETIMRKDSFGEALSDEIEEED